MDILGGFFSFNFAATTMKFIVIEIVGNFVFHRNAIETPFFDSMKYVFGLCIKKTTIDIKLHQNRWIFANKFLRVKLSNV